MAQAIQYEFEIATKFISSEAREERGQPTEFPRHPSCVNRIVTEIEQCSSEFMRNIDFIFVYKSRTKNGGCIRPVRFRS